MSAVPDFRSTIGLRYRFEGDAGNVFTGTVVSEPFTVEREPARVFEGRLIPPEVTQGTVVVRLDPECTGYFRPDHTKPSPQMWITHIVGHVSDIIPKEGP